MKYNYSTIDFMVLLPCPMKGAFGRLANQIAIRFAKETGERISFLPLSAMDPEIIRDLMSIQNPDDFPAVMMIPGMGFPCTERFKKMFRDTGCFESILKQTNPSFRKYGFYDPKGYYDVVGMNPIAFFCDRTYHPELTPPRSWDVLLHDPQYCRTVGMPGRETSGFQDFPIMAAYHLYGEDGVRALARTARSCLLPAEMVRMAGSRRDIAPPIGILNFAMAKAAGQKNSCTEFIWPEEGVYAGPMLMLTRKTASEKARALAKQIVGPETAAAFRVGGFYSASDPEPLGEGNVFWFGWDFLEKTDIPALSARLSRLMMENCDLVHAGQALKKGCVQ